MARRYSLVPTEISTVGLASGSVIYTPVFYPPSVNQEGDYYIIAGEGDRLDNIAFDFYGDPKLWWVIASENNLPGDSLYIPGPDCGKQLKIPATAEGVQARYIVENI